MTKLPLISHQNVAVTLTLVGYLKCCKWIWLVWIIFRNSQSVPTSENLSFKMYSWDKVNPMQWLPLHHDILSLCYLSSMWEKCSKLSHIHKMLNESVTNQRVEFGIGRCSHCTFSIVLQDSPFLHWYSNVTDAMTVSVHVLLQRRSFALKW